MIDNTMPERIYTQRGSAMDVLGNNLPYLNEEVEYVRADLVAGNAKEPLEAGQYRWCRVNEDGKWEPVAILKSPFCDHLVYYITGDEMEDYVEDCYEMGPVIRPPETW